MEPLVKFCFKYQTPIMSSEDLLELDQAILNQDPILPCHVSMADIDTLEERQALEDKLKKRYGTSDKGVWTMGSWQNYTVSLAYLQRKRLPVEIVEWRSTVEVGPLPAIASMSEPVHAPPLNDKVQVAVAGFGLMSVRHVLLLADGCTDALQDKLCDGWFILAICVQPDQRRPDYILGFSGERLDSKGNPVIDKPQPRTY